MMSDEGAAPGPSKTPQEWLTEVRALEHDGELFRAFDVARQGLGEFPDELALKHRAVLCLASTGTTDKALRLYLELGLDHVAAGVLDTPLALDVAALGARLLKDIAFAAEGNARGAAMARAASAYQSVYRKAVEAGNAEAYYPGVNAATLALLAGRTEEGFALARDVLDRLARWPAGKKGFYEAASELEAQLVLGDLERARDSVAAIEPMMRGATYADLRANAAMLRQLQAIIAAKGLDPALLEPLTPARIIHYVGHIIAPPGQPGRFPAQQEDSVRRAIAERLAADDVGCGYGSLAAGADILFAEALLERHARLELVLPFDRDEFVEVSVRPAGKGWVERFETCFAAVAADPRKGSIRYATEDRYLGDDNLFRYCSQLAMGLALLRARHLMAAVEQVAVWDGMPPTGSTGTAADITAWRRTGMPQQVIPVGNGFTPEPKPTAPGRGMARHGRAMLFGDIHGFSKLTDAQLPKFIDLVLGCFAAMIERNSGDILLANTWGDGLFLVFDNAAKAADCALQLQEAVAGIDVASNGLPEDLGLRVGLHLGPAYEAYDPILKRDNYFGAHVSRAARIEPVTPEGSVYVTETMAAVLELYDADSFTCDYVGMTEAAKHYGAMRMFLLRRRGG